MYEILGTGFKHWIWYGDMNAHQEYMQLGTQFSMEVRMSTQNMYEISGTAIGHWIPYGDKKAH